MGGITGITNADNSQLAITDANNDGVYQIDEDIKIDPAKDYKVFGTLVKGDQLLKWLKGSGFVTGDSLDINKFVELATKASPAAGEQKEVTDKLAALKLAIEDLRKTKGDVDKQVATLTEQYGKMPDKTTLEAKDLAEQIKQLTKIAELTESERSFAEKQATKLIAQLEGKTLTTPAAAQKLAALKTLMQQPLATQQAALTADPAAGGGLSPKFATGGGGGGQPAAASGPQTPQQAWGAPGGQTIMPKFDTASYMQSVMQQNAIVNNMDNLGESQMKSQKMMMLFFFLSRMAATGDLGAMYQFMQFITYVISKDKALQNIDMANKLIALQDMSRKNTQMLLDSDTSDPNKVNDFYKKMEQVKSNESGIAMSQKLIAQMMEEMAQVVEVLTGATQAALQAEGRVLRSVARMG